MARKRNSDNSKLPPYTYRNNGRYIYRPYLGTLNGKPRFGKDVRLGPLDMPMSELWKAHERTTGSAEKILSWLVNLYLESDQAAAEISGRTLAGYKGYAEVILRQPLNNDRTFGDLELGQINKRVIRKYLDKYPFKVSGNRHIQFLSSVFAWGGERYIEAENNPCYGVKLNKETPRERYIEDWEYEVVFQCALEARNPYFAAAMELAYLLRARREEIFPLTAHDLRKHGVFLNRAKGSLNEITTWSDRLQKAVDLCAETYPKAPIKTYPALLIKNKEGNIFNKNALDTAWQNIIKKAMKKGAYICEENAQEARDLHVIPTNDGNFILTEKFNFHDIKAKGVTDHNNNESGHKSKKMQAVYNRKPKLIESTR